MVTEKPIIRYIY